MTIAAEQVQVGLAAALKKAGELNSPSSITIIDDGLNLLGFLRMDGALLASIEISQGKAYTARSLNMKTADVMPLVQPGGPFYGMENSHRQPLIAFAGGVPIMEGDKVIGAVGVAGGALPDDEAIALAAASAIAG